MYYYNRSMFSSSFTTIGIGNYAFWYCTSWLIDVDLTEGLQKIRRCTFQRCTFLHCINIPSTVTAIDDIALENARHWGGFIWSRRCIPLLYFIDLYQHSIIFNSLDLNTFRHCTLWGCCNCSLFCLQTRYVWTVSPSLQSIGAFLLK